jgi:PncC family amidohydrolase
VDAASAEAAEQVGRVSRARGERVVTAESVTAGGIATALAAAGDASEWLCGGVVAYSTATKLRVLGVTAERIISAECATQMAEGALAVAGADLVVAVTGVGGPDDEEGRPPGTVYICTGRDGVLDVREYAFEGEPAEVVAHATREALVQLHASALVTPS